MPVGVWSLDNQVEVRQGLIEHEGLDLRVPFLETLLFTQVIEVVEDRGRCWDLAHLELVANDGVKEVFALRIKRRTHAPCV